MTSNLPIPTTPLLHPPLPLLPPLLLPQPPPPPLRPPASLSCHASATSSPPPHRCLQPPLRCLPTVIPLTSLSPLPLSLASIKPPSHGHASDLPLSPPVALLQPPLLPSHLRPPTPTSTATISSLPFSPPALSPPSCNHNASPTGAITTSDLPLPPCHHHLPLIATSNLPFPPCHHHLSSSPFRHRHLFPSPSPSSHGRVQPPSLPSCHLAYGQESWLPKYDQTVMEEPKLGPSRKYTWKGETFHISCLPPRGRTP